MLKAKIRTLLDFAPLGAFLLGYLAGGLMAATATLMATTGLVLAIIYYYERKISLAPLITGLVVGIFGGLTLVLQDETFIKIKPTIINLLFAVILLGGLWRGKPLLRYLLGSALHLSEEGWRVLSLRWGVFFIFLALLNEIIWRHFSTDFWVKFKVFGMLSCTILFSLAQAGLLKRYHIESKD